MQGLTSNDTKEIKGIIETLTQTDAGTNLIHESFHTGDPTKFTRSWFAWGNSLFAEFILKSIGLLA